MAWVNEELARRFGEIATLLELDGADRFRVRAYERARDAIGAAPVDLADVAREDLPGLKGIGASTATKVAEYLDTGTIGMLEELRRKVPAGLLQLIRVPGLGPKTAVQLHDALGIDSIDALRAALDSHRLRDLPGLGAKKEESLRQALERLGAKDSDRVPAADAIALAEELVTRMRAVPGVEEVAYAGSLRRMRETIGDVDVLVASTEPASVHEAFKALDVVERVLAAGERKTSVLTVRGIQADLRVVDPTSWGAALQYFTGSRDHNIRVRERAVRRGVLVNEYGVFVRDEEIEDYGPASPAERLASRSEEDVYAAMGLQCIPPTMREDRGEVDAAAAGTLPAVVTLEDVTGDLHGHSSWSGDGKATLEDVVAAAAGKGYAYWAVTDHAEGLPMNGMSRAAVLARREAIGRLQDATPGLRILEGLELNIGIDGTVDYDRELLLSMDWNVASVHTLMHRSEAEQTARLIIAMQHPAVHAIGHLTGRKIGVRPGYDVDLAAILEAARETGTALEVNASPRRLDLSGELVRRAVDAGVTLTISCDAHSVGDLASMRYGVWTAQRGWATAASVLNTRSLEDLFAFTAAKRERWS